MGGYEKYESALLEAARQMIFESDRRGDAKKILRRGIEELISKKAPEPQVNSLTSKEEHIQLLYRGFEGVQGAFQTMQDIQLYVRRFPYGNTSITKTRHLRYHVENYLEKMYILKNRLICYLNTVKKAFKSDRRRLQVERGLEKLDGLVTDTLKPIAGEMVRGRHVHVARFSPEEIDRLVRLELLIEVFNSTGDDLHYWFDKIRDDEYVVLRTNRAKSIENWNLTTKELLDVYYEVLYETVFDANGEVVIPQT